MTGATLAPQRDRPRAGGSANECIVGGRRHEERTRSWGPDLRHIAAGRQEPDAADRVLPAAGLLLRLGQDDLLGKDGLGWNAVAAVIGAAGGALFANLALLFAVGVAIGIAKKADGSTALAAVVGYLVFKGVG